MEGQSRDKFDRLKVLGKKLEKGGIGGYVEVGAEDPCVSIFYFTKPPDADHAFLDAGVVLMFSSEILKSLCELTDIGRIEILVDLQEERIWTPLCAMR